MKHILNAMLVIAGVLTVVPAWAQPPSVTYSFSSASAAGSSSGIPPMPSRAPGADALRWLGGLGSSPAEPSPASIAAADRAAVAHRH